MADNCIFCGIVAGSISSRIVYEDEFAMAFQDMNPVAPTHILVVPKTHIQDLASAADEDQAALGAVQIAIRSIAAEAGLKDFRVVMNNGRGAGQSVFHIHYHILSGRRMNWPPG